jgi:hypothetical protein
LILQLLNSTVSTEEIVQHQIKWEYGYKAEVPKLCLPLEGGGGGALFVLWGGVSCLYEGHIYFEQKMGARYDIYFSRHFAWMKYKPCFIL